MHISFDGSKLRLSIPYSPETVTLIKKLPSRTWDSKSKTWLIPPQYTIWIIKLLKASRENFDSSAQIFYDSALTLSQERQNLLVKKKDNPPTILPTDYQFKLKPYNYQVRAFNYARPFKSFALFMELGTGKTKVSIDLAQDKINKGLIDRVLIICPLSMLWVWEYEILKNLYVGKSRIHIIYGTKEKRIDMLDKFFRDTRSSWAITNWDGLIILEDYRKKNPIITEISSQIDDKTMIIYDESSKAKNVAAKRTRTAVKIADLTSHKLILTGLPTPNTLIDIFSQWAIIDRGEAFGRSIAKFKDKYFYLPYPGSFRWIPREGTKDKITAVIARQSFSIKKKDCLDLPPIIKSKRFCILSDKAQKIYKEIATKFVSEFNDEYKEHKVTAQNVLVRIIRLSQITSGFVKDEEGFITVIDDKKFALFETLIDEELKDQKIAVWSNFVFDIERIYTLLKAKGYNPVAYYGKITSVKERTQSVRKFQNYPDCRAFVGNPAAGGFGLTLTATNKIIYYSSDYNYEYRYQSEGRHHRIGSEIHDDVTYFDLLAKGTVDESIQTAMRNKSKLGEILNPKNIEDFVFGELDA